MLVRKLLKLTPEALWIFVERVGVLFCGFAGIKLLTYLMEPSEFGRLAIASTVMALIGTNLFSSLSQGFMRFWSISNERKELEQFYAVSTRFSQCLIGLVICLAVLSLVFGKLIKDYNWAVLAAFSLLAGAAMGWLGLRVAVFMAIRKRRRIALLRVSNSFLRPLVAAILIILISSNANWVIMGYLLATFAVVLGAERLYRQTVSSTLSAELKVEQPVRLFHGLGKEILSYSWPFFAWGLFSWIHMSCDRWALQAFHGSEVLGSFAVVAQLATFPLIFISGFLSALFTPIAFQKAGDLTDANGVKDANKILLGMTGIFILGSFALIGIFTIIHHPLILLISNERFASLSYLLPGLTIAWSFFYLGQLFSFFGLLVNQSHSYIAPKLVSAMVAAVGTFYLSAKMGPSGVVLSLGIAGFVYVIWCVAIALKLRRITEELIKTS